MSAPSLLTATLTPLPSALRHPLRTGQLSAIQITHHTHIVLIIPVCSQAPLPLRTEQLLEVQRAGLFALVAATGGSAAQPTPKAMKTTAPPPQGPAAATHPVTTTASSEGAEQWGPLSLLCRYFTLSCATSLPGDDPPGPGFKRAEQVSVTCGCMFFLCVLYVCV